MATYPIFYSLYVFSSNSALIMYLLKIMCIFLSFDLETDKCKAWIWKKSQKSDTDSQCVGVLRLMFCVFRKEPCYFSSVLECLGDLLFCAFEIALWIATGLFSLYLFLLATIVGTSIVVSCQYLSWFAREYASRGVTS